MILENAGYAVAGLSGFLLLGNMLTTSGLRVIALKLILLALVVLAALAAFKLLGDRRGHLLGWLAGIGVLFIGLVLIGIF